MYADRSALPNRLNAAGLAAAIGLNAAVVAALIFSAPAIVTKGPSAPLKFIQIFTPEPPPPEPTPPPQQQTASHPAERVDAPKSDVAIPSVADFTVADLPPLPPVGSNPGTDLGPTADVDPLPPPELPTLIEPSLDPRYRGDVQPVYPAAERRAGREGRVTIRVLVGVDGRVKQAERVSATSDAFWQATRGRALAAWRFRPATRGGVPVEAWQTLSLTFVLED